jgi:hypothetical protein
VISRNIREPLYRLFRGADIPDFADSDSTGSTGLLCFGQPFLIDFKGCNFKNSMTEIKKNLLLRIASTTEASACKSTCFVEMGRKIAALSMPCPTKFNIQMFTDKAISHQGDSGFTTEQELFLTSMFTNVNSTPHCNPPWHTFPTKQGEEQMPVFNPNKPNCFNLARFKFRVHISSSCNF